MSGDEDDNMRMEFSPSMEPSVTFAWSQVSDVLDDPPGFLMDESLGVQFKGSDEPALDILVGDDDTQLKVSSRKRNGKVADS